MIYQKDWLVRQIESMISAITHLIAGSTAIHEDTARLELEMRDRVADAVKSGELCDTENWLYENLNSEDAMWLRLSVFFYNEANMQSDSFLNAHDFSREEIASGLKEVCETYGFPIF